MKKFLEFIQFRENENQSQIAPGGQLPLANASGQGALPPGGPGSGHEDKIIEELGNSLRRVLEEKLFPALDKSHLSKESAMKLLQTITSEVANKFGLSSSAVQQSSHNAMTTNSEPRMPAPKQPTAT